MMSTKKQSTSRPGAVVSKSSGNRAQGLKNALWSKTGAAIVIAIAFGITAALVIPTFLTIGDVGGRERQGFASVSVIDPVDGSDVTDDFTIRVLVRLNDSEYVEFGEWDDISSMKLIFGIQFQGSNITRYWANISTSIQSYGHMSSTMIYIDGDFHFPVYLSKQPSNTTWQFTYLNGTPTIPDGAIATSYHLNVSSSEYMTRAWTNTWNIGVGSSSNRYLMVNITMNDTLTFDMLGSIMNASHILYNQPSGCNTCGMMPSYLVMNGSSTFIVAFRFLRGFNQIRIDIPSNLSVVTTSLMYGPTIIG